MGGSFHSPNIDTTDIDDQPTITEHPPPKKKTRDPTPPPNK